MEIEKATKEVDEVSISVKEGRVDIKSGQK